MDEITDETIPITEAEIITLIRDTYNGLIDPLQEGLAAARIERFCYGGDPPAVWIAGLPLHNPSNTEWDVDRIYLIDNSLSEERYLDLEEGAEPADEERELFREAAEEFDGHGADIYRLRALEGAEGETRSVFLVGVARGGGNAVDMVGHAGPFTTAEQVKKYLIREWGTPEEWEIEDES